MVKQIVFSGILFITLFLFSYTLRRLGLLFKLTRKPHHLDSGANVWL